MAATVSVTLDGKAVTATRDRNRASWHVTVEGTYAADLVFFDGRCRSRYVSLDIDYSAVVRAVSDFLAVEEVLRS